MHIRPGKNICWQVADFVTIGTTAHFEAVVLGKTLIAVNTGAPVPMRPPQAPPGLLCNSTAELSLHAP
ncbi:MAG: DUF3494 domain-containing protein [Ramlibacter sp.]|nr:DUF3494 domain-containing protein [Ramlibacter sp.]